MRHRRFLIMTVATIGLASLTPGIAMSAGSAKPKAGAYSTAGRGTISLSFTVNRDRRTISGFDASCPGAGESRNITIGSIRISHKKSSYTFSYKRMPPCPGSASRGPPPRR